MTQRGGIITGFLLRAVFTFAVAGISVYEAGAIIVTKVAVDGIAQEAAREAAIGYAGSSGSTSKAKRECQRMAARSGAICDWVKPAGGQIQVHVSKEAPTLIVHRIGFLKPHTTASADGRAQIP